MPGYPLPNYLLPEYPTTGHETELLRLIRRMYHAYRRVTGVNVPGKSTRWVRLLMSLLNTSANVRCES